MKSISLYVLFFSVILFVHSTVEMKAQNGFKIELISTRLVNEVIGAFGDKWQTTDSTKFRGLIIKTRITRTPNMDTLQTAHLIFNCKIRKEKTQAVCYGSARMGSEKDDGYWMFNRVDKNKYYDIPPPPKEDLEYISFLFPIPAGVQNGSLTYHKRVLMQKVKIK
jgi:hypothetical protein